MYSKLMGRQLRMLDFHLQYEILSSIQLLLAVINSFTNQTSTYTIHFYHSNFRLSTNHNDSSIELNLGLSKNSFPDSSINPTSFSVYYLQPLNFFSAAICL